MTLPVLEATTISINQSQVSTNYGGWQGRVQIEGKKNSAIIPSDTYIMYLQDYRQSTNRKKPLRKYYPNTKPTRLQN